MTVTSCLYRDDAARYMRQKGLKTKCVKQKQNIDRKNEGGKGGVANEKITKTEKNVN